MKKCILLGCVILIGISPSFAQTTNTTTDSTVTAPSGVTDPLTVILKNIDRRIAVFNRYVVGQDWDALKTLVSEENKDFYANFLAYVQTAPVFTVKRDVNQGIVKTPQDEYIFPALLALEWKEAKITMTFLEEDFETGDKWVIVDSNLHIVGKPLSPAQTEPVPSPTGSSLASSTIKKDTPSLPATTPDSSTVQASSPPETVSPSDTSLDSIAVTQVQTTTPTRSTIDRTPDSTSTSRGIGTLLFFLVVALLWGALLYYFLVKRGKHGREIAALGAIANMDDALVSVPPLVPTSPNISEPAVIPSEPVSPAVPLEKTALEQMESNVSLVEEIPASVVPSEPIVSEQPAVPHDIFAPLSVPEVAPVPAVPEVASSPAEPLDDAPVVSPNPSPAVSPLFENILSPDDSSKPSV